MNNIVILIIIAILRPIIRPFDIFYIFFMQQIPANQVEQSHTIQQFLITAVITSFIADSPLGLLPLVSSVVLLVGYKMTPILVNAGLSRYIIWQSQLLIIFILEILLRNLFTMSDFALLPSNISPLITTIILGTVISLFAAKKRL